MDTLRHAPNVTRRASGIPCAIPDGRRASERIGALIRSVWESVRRARREIIGVALVYAVSVTVGAVQVHRGNAFALRYGDDLVARAHQSDPASIADRNGHHVECRWIADIRADSASGVGRRIT